MSTSPSTPVDKVETDAPPVEIPWGHLPEGLQLILNADLMGKEFRRTARELLVMHDLNDRRASVISFLAQVGPQTINELARRLEQHKAAISALLIRMEGDGLIEFTPNPEDRRSKTAGLTDKGLQLAEPIRAALENMARFVTDNISHEEIEMVSAVLLRISDNFSKLGRPDEA